MREFKIRCSAIGQIMSEPRNKTAKEKGELSETAKTYSETWLKEQIYSRRKTFTNKYVEKGIRLESEAIQAIEDYYDYDFLFKNETEYENEHITGTPDVLLYDVIRDTKCSYDCFTFPLFEEKLPNKGYFYQMQGYMHLTGKRKAFVDYVLLDNDEDDYNELDVPYSSLEHKYLIKSFEVKYDPAVIEKVQQKVIKCREYINHLKSKI